MAGSSNAVTKEAASNNSVSKLTWDWVADSANGSVPTAQTTDTITGFVLFGETNPGSTAPTDNYDITITNEEGTDVFGGALMDRDTANNEQAMPAIGGGYGPRFVNSKLTMTLTNNAVNSATGRLVVFVEAPRY